MKLPLLASLLLATTAPALAQSADSAAANPLTFYGFVDGYFGYDLRSPDTRERPFFLYSHSRQNEFTVNQGLIGVRYDDGRVRGTAALHTGTYPQANYAAEPIIFRNIYEAYAGFRPFRKAWLDAGVFSSHLGMESAISKDNWTLTRSLMAENSPYYEAGVRLTYEAAPTLTLTGLVLNGWQNIRETNQAKALGTQVQWQAAPKLLVNSSTFYGNEQPDSLRVRRRYFHDFYVKYQASSRLSLALVFDVGKQKRARNAGYDTWHAASVFAKYQLAPKFSATLRGEYYYAERGVVIIRISPDRFDSGLRLAGGSLNFDYTPTPNVAFRVEGRYLNASNLRFVIANNELSREYTNLTSSIALSF